MSGKKQEIDALYAQGSKIDLSQTSDVNAVAGVLKRYLKEGPPLLPNYSEFVVCGSISDEKQRVQKLTQLVENLPESNQAILFVLFDFLKYVHKYSFYNGMDAHNLSLVFSPLVLRNDANPMKLSDDRDAIAIVGETILFNKEKIFYKLFVSETFTPYLLQMIKRRPQSFEDEVVLPKSTEESEYAWVEFFTEEGNLYYYNTISGETRWEKPATFGMSPKSPKNRVGLPKDWEEARDESGNVYYYNTVTNETSWYPPG